MIFRAERALSCFALTVFCVAVWSAPVHAATPSISAGGRHTLALKSDGSVRAWGHDGFGQLGDDRQVNLATPALVAGVSGIRAISAGGHHTVALRTDGSIWAWGNNSYGEIGNSSTANQLIPVQLSAPTGVIAVSAGWFHTAALKADGTVWSWGANESGELGDGTTTDRSAAVQAAGLTGVIAIAASGSGGFTLALKSDGTVWAWGSNDSGQLGDGTTITRTTPVRVGGLTGITAISAGREHALALKSDGSVWAWGLNFSNQIGDGTSVNRSSPVQVIGLTGVTAISAGAAHNLALKGDRTVWAWGQNYSGSLGDGTFTNRSVAVQVSGLTNVASISAGGYQSFALQVDGSAWGWGFNSYGQIGDGADSNLRATPARIIGVTNVVALSSGQYHTAALRSDGSVYAWGSDGFDQLGRGVSYSQPTPLAISPLTDVVAISAGGYHSVALKGDGSVWAWGINEDVELGDGTGWPRETPQRINITGVIAISAGRFHTLALKSDGSVWAWGYNGFGEVGSGTDVVLQSTPVQVVGLSGAIAISAGYTHSLALRADGTVWAWGSNDYGQLGDGTSILRPTPIQVPGLGGVIAIDAGASHSIALKSDRSAWAWGNNAEGEIGDGTTALRRSPVQVSGLSGVVSISGGGSHTLALKSDGSVWAWGYNRYGQLGDGTAIDRSSPVQVRNLSSVVAIEAGHFHSAALQGNGTARSWGWNTDGQIGDGTLADRSTPAVVFREDGAGTVATNDWFLDLNPAIAKTIPSDQIPAFLIVASGSPSTVVTADVQFRSQDVGKPIHVFAYAPSTLAKAAKDGPTCVLAQLTPSGLQQVSASGLQNYANNVTGSQHQAVTVLNNVPTSQVAGATFCVGSGTTGTQSVAAANNQCVVTVPADAVCLPPAGDTSATPANSPGALSGLWWNSGESGWGIHFTQRRNIVFAAWYTYDGSGNPKWYVASNCTMPTSGATSGTCGGVLYEVNGPTFFGTVFNPAAVNVTTAGSLQVNFQNANAASMTYTASGQTRTVPITRQPIAGGTTPPAVDYTDLWWNPSESGWGIAVTQQYGVMFLAWYVYDSAGRPVWYVASNCAVSGNGCSGTLYRTTGPAFGLTFDPAQIQVFTAGTVSLSFSDANNGTLSYTVNGVSSTKTITRQLF